jgi:hypothetical protein
MGTQNVTVGTTPVLVTPTIDDDELIDILIQNLSTNNVYVGTNDAVSTSNGIKLIPGGDYCNDKRRHAVWLIADAASSDVRVCYEKYKVRSR